MAAGLGMEMDYFMRWISETLLGHSLLITKSAAKDVLHGPTGLGPKGLLPS